MVFAGPLRNYIQDSDVLIAISSSGNSENIIRAVELARSQKVPVIGISGFDGGRLNPLSDAKILIPTTQGEYELVEGIHAIVLHIFTKYFKDYFDHVFLLGRGQGAVHGAAISSADDRTYASL
jgi:D-sedoheptulose 7-phosphate isomerase